MLNKRIIFILFVFLAVSGVMSLVSAEDMGDDIGNVTSDELYVVGAVDDVSCEGNVDEDILEIECDDDSLESSSEGTFTELQNKIDKAKKGSTVYLTKDYYYDEEFSTNGIKITKSLTIDGNGHYIGGNDESALLLINKVNNVVLKNIVFKDGYIDNSGVLAIFNSNNIKFINCVFLYNYADDGGAIFLAYSNYSSFVGCDFIYNSATNNGGAIYFACCHDFSLDSCRFGGNEAEYGGAVYLSDCYKNSFDSCAFANNTGDNGGALYLTNCQDSSFDGCWFNYNEAEYGGAVYLGYSSSSFVGCNFKLKPLDLNNIPYMDFDFDDVDLDEDDCFEDDEEDYGYVDFDEYLEDNPAYIDYGTIYSFQSVLNILNSNFNNSYVNVAGADVSSQQSMIFLTNSSFSNSHSWGYGGSLSFDDDYVQIVNCTFVNCSSFYDAGGAVYCFNSIMDCHSSLFKNCSAVYGGAICSLNTDLIIQGDVFDSNDAFNNGGSVFSRFGSIGVDSSIFLYSSAWTGGAMYISSPYLISNITNNRFSYCSAVTNGYRLWIDGYYDEIPISGNVYEDVYFVYGRFTTYDELGIEDMNEHSNILTYIFTNSDEYHNISFYENLRDIFYSNVNYTGAGGHFNISDENHPNNSIILSKFDDYGDCHLTYDLDYFYNEFNSSHLRIGICNIEGYSLDHIESLGFYENELLETRIFYYSPYYSGFSLYPVDYDKMNVTAFDKYKGTPYLWFSSLTQQEAIGCKIGGRLSFNFEDRDLYYNSGNSYDRNFEYPLVPLFNPKYDNESSFPVHYITDSFYYAKDQGIGSNCWAFAGISTLETCINKITGEDYVFSVNNVKNLMAASSIYGLNLDNNGGGYDSMLMSYLASWLGPIDEDNDKYNPLSSFSVRQSELFNIQNIAFLSPRKNSLDNDEFKYAIKNYGAVAVTFNWTTDKYMGLHSVSIIGWDDDYRGLDSLGNYASGAWIFLNSWGDEWGFSLDDDYEQGYGYLSYNQKLSGELAPYLHAYTFPFNDGDAGYQNIYQHDYAGFTDFLCCDDFVYYKNKFVAEDDEYLMAFSTYFEKPAYFTFSLRVNGKDINMTQDNVVIVESIHYSSAGYHTVPLGYNITLNKGDEFEIIIKLVNTKNYVPVSQADELYASTYPSNVSFISFNGEDWFDLYDLNSTNMFLYGGNKSDTCQVACIKAFTVNCKRASLLGYFDFNGRHVLDSVYHYYYELAADMYSNSIYIYFDEDDSILDKFEFYLELNFDDGKEIRYLKFDGGANYLFADEFNGRYKCTAKLVSNFLSSNVLYLDFISYNENMYSPFSKLQELIDNASEGDVIDLYENYGFDIYSNSSEYYILINKSLTIDGSPVKVNRTATIDGVTYYDDGPISLNGFNRSGIFKIMPNCNVTLKNIKFKTGHSGNFGAIVSYGNLTIINCHFENNYADLYGGAIFAGESSNLKIINSDFKDNNAGDYGGSIFSRGFLNITSSDFKSNEDVEVIYFDSVYDENNQNMYLKGNKMTSKAASVYYSGESVPYGSPLYLVFYKGSKIKGENVNLFQIINDDGNTFRFRDVNVTIGNQNIKIEYSRMLGGYVFDTSSLEYGTYKLTGSVSKLYASNCTVREGILYVVKKSVISASALLKVYGSNKKLTVTLKDSNGKAIANVFITVKLNGKTFKIKTNSKGKVALSVRLAPKRYVATVTFAGNTKYSTATKNVKVTIKKAKLKIKAKKKTFKLKTKVKKYTITLKNNVGKAMKKTVVRLKIKGKTYKAKTNKKGKATFKIKNLKKKGTFKATIKYKGSKYYKAFTKNVKITVKK